MNPVHVTYNNICGTHPGAENNYTQAISAINNDGSLKKLKSPKLDPT